MAGWEEGVGIQGGIHIGVEYLSMGLHRHLVYNIYPLPIQKFMGMIIRRDGREDAEPFDYTTIEDGNSC